MSSQRFPTVASYFYQLAPLIFITSFILCDANKLPLNPDIANLFQFDIHREKWITDARAEIPSEFTFRTLLEDAAPFIFRQVLRSNDSESYMEEIISSLRTDTTASQTCADDINAFVLQLFRLLASEIPDTWALKMVDSWGRLPSSGILSGNLADPGDFLECIKLNGQYKSLSTSSNLTVKGQYCTTYLLPGPNFGRLMGGEPQGDGKEESGLLDTPSVLEILALIQSGVILPTIGTCFPSTCSIEEVQFILSSLYNFTTGGLLNQYVGICTPPEKPALDAGDYAVITILSVVAALCIVATVWDLHSRSATAKSRQSSSLTQSPLPMKILLGFSVYTNTKKWLLTETGSDNLGCLHGLRTLSMAWVVLAHTWSVTNVQSNSNRIDILNWYKKWSSYPIFNATVSVDTFLCMSGALMAYNLLREFDRSGGKLNYPLLVLHRYFRLTPTYILIVAITATILPYFGSGPYWFLMDSFRQGCEAHWWHNMLYINNFFDYTATTSGECLTESWYLAIDMQFFLLAPLVIYPLWRWNFIGYGILALLSAISMITTPVIMYAKELPPTALVFSDQKTYNDDIYKKPWTRCGPYIVGLILGYVLYLRKKEPKKFQHIPHGFVILGWILSTVTALAIIYGPMDLFDPANADKILSWYSYVYGGVHRYLWGVMIAWIVFACVNGNGGLVNDFLSWKVFVPLGRLTFCMYIISLHIQLMYNASQVLLPVYVSAYSMTFLFFSHLIASGLVAYVLMITLESPFIQIEKLLLSPPRSSGGDAEAMRSEIKNGIPSERQ